MKYSKEEDGDLLYKIRYSDFTRIPSELPLDQIPIKDLGSRVMDLLSEGVPYFQFVIYIDSDTSGIEKWS